MTWKCTNTPKGENKLYSDARGVVPSLDLRFAEGKTLNDYITGTPLVDHQRSMNGSNLSPGTFVNSSGFIETAKVNLLSYSEDIKSGVWFKANATVDPDASLSPAGTLTADTLNVNIGATFSRLQISNLGLASGVYTLSYYVKNTVDLGINLVQILDSSNTTDTTIVFDFSSTTTPNWTRYQVVFDIGATALTNLNQLRIDFRPSPSPSTGSSKVDIWGIQLEEGSTATTYIPTTDLPSAAPRFDHDPTTGESLGLLVEESRTNYIDNSTTLSGVLFDGGTGVAPQVGTVTTVGPDGVSASITRYQLDRGTGNTTNDYSLVTYSPTTPSAFYSESIWLKSNDANSYVLQFYDFGGSKGKEIIVTPQWQRFTIDASTSYKNSNDTANTSPDIAIGLRNDPTSIFYYAGNTNSQTADILVWGPQIENGTFVTSYIPTTGTALTRSADVAEITGANFSSWYNQAEGTVFHEGRYIADISGGNYGVLNGLIFYFTNTGLNSFTNQWSLGIGKLAGTSNPASLSSALYNGTTLALVNVADQLANNPVGSRMKSVGFINTSTGEFGHALDGGTIRSNSNPNIPIWDKLSLSTAYNNQARCGTIARLTYFPERLPDSSLQTITTP